MTRKITNRFTTSSTHFFYGYIIVILAFLLLAMTMGTFFTIGVFLKPMIAELGWSRALVSGALSITWVVSGFLSIIAGGLNDRFGPRAILTVCVLCTGIGYLLVSQVSVVWQLYLYYSLFIGVGLCSFIPLSATIVRWFVKRRSLMIGIFLAGGGVGMLIGPPIANQLILAYDWRLSYIIIGSIYLIITLIASQFLKRDPAKMGQTSYGESEMTSDVGYSEANSIPVKNIVSTKRFWILIVVQICIGITIHSVMVHIVPYATDLGVLTTSAASILSIIGIVTIIGRIVLGGASDRIGNIQVLAISFILMMMAFLWLLCSKDVWQFYLFAVVFGIAFGGFVTQQAPLVAVLFGLSSYGLILALASLGYTIGSAIGPVLAGYLFDLSDSYHTAFLIIAGISIAGLVLTILLKQPTSKSTRKT